MAIILFTFAVQKDRFGRFEKGHSFKKPRDDRGLELAKSWRKMSNKKFITWEVQGSGKSNCEEHTPRGSPGGVLINFQYGGVRANISFLDPKYWVSRLEDPKYCYLFLGPLRRTTFIEWVTVMNRTKLHDFFLSSDLWTPNVKFLSCCYEQLSVFYPYYLINLTCQVLSSNIHFRPPCLI